MTPSTLTRERLSGLQEAASRELAELRDRRPGMALEALQGSEAARRELAEISERMAALEAELDAAMLAESEVERLARDAAEAATVAAREQQEAESVRLDELRHAQLANLQRSATKLGQEAAEVLATDAAFGDLSRALGRPTRAWGELVADLVAVRVRDQVPGIGQMGPVFAFRRNQLLEEFALDDEPADDPLAAVAKGRCSVCDHAEADAIQQALVAGESLRTLEERFGVSRSALSRHRQHAALQVSQQPEAD